MLTLLVTFHVAGQGSAKRGLWLTGTVKSVESVCINKAPAMQINVFMQFRNDGHQPLVLIHPAYYFNAKVNFLIGGEGISPKSIVSNGALRFNPYLDNPFGSATVDDYDPFPSYMEKLRSAKPPFVLEPGEYSEFWDSIWLTDGFGVESEIKACESEKDLSRIDAVPIPKYQFFELEYHLSFKKYDGGTDLLRTLQNRWKKFGHLVLDNNGDVTFKSEPIIFSAYRK